MVVSKLSVLAALPVVLVVALASQAVSRDLNEVLMIQKHEQWMAQYGRVYSDDVEKGVRYKIFKENVEFIESFDKAGTKSYTLGINKFADMTNEEFKAARNRYKPLTGLRGTLFSYQNASAIPASLDWRNKGAVTPIKDQGQCGCCWAFSAVAAVEGVHQLQTGKLVSLSEQELVDCDTDGEDQGCDGGLMDDAFSFIVENGGLTTEASYPYKAEDGKCNGTRKTSHAAATINGFEDVPANSEDALLKAVANQPVSVAIEASDSSFQFYSGGVFSGDCGTQLDHGVTAIGYGTSSSGTKYWLVKNSWGTSWGEKGYIRMQRGIAAKEGLCGIAMQASYPTA